MWTCPDCETVVFGDPQQHSCPKRLDRVARGFENRERPWLKEASPPEELLTRVRAFVGDRIDWGWRVVWDDGIRREIQVLDEDLDPPIQTRRLDHMEDWESVFRDLGLLR